MAFGRNGCDCCDELIEAIEGGGGGGNEFQFEGIPLIAYCDIDTGELVGYGGVTRTEADPPVLETIWLDTGLNIIGGQPANSEPCTKDFEFNEILCDVEWSITSGRLSGISVNGGNNDPVELYDASSGALLDSFLDPNYSFSRGYWETTKGMFFAVDINNTAQIVQFDLANLGLGTPLTVVQTGLAPVGADIRGGVYNPANGLAYIHSDSGDVWEIDIDNLTMDYLGNITGLVGTSNVLGLYFDDSGVCYITDVDGVSGCYVYRLDIASLVATEVFLLAGGFNSIITAKVDDYWLLQSGPDFWIYHHPSECYQLMSNYTPQFMGQKATLTDYSDIINKITFVRVYHKDSAGNITTQEHRLNGDDYTPSGCVMDCNTVSKFVNDDCETSRKII